MTHRQAFSGTSDTWSQILWVFCGLFLVAGAAGAQTRYETEVMTWKSHEEVGKWLKSNFVFDKNRQAQVQAHLKDNGVENVLTRKPDTLFENRNGHCRDSAAFARDALNRISPAYKARYIFIKNKSGPPNHWVTGYIVDGKLYVMDYGAGKQWWQLEGVHGPFESLEDYKTFLASLTVKGFAPEFVRWRDIPGQQD